MPQIGHGSALFDDTPVNGELEKGITSNWAFDEDATLRALIEATLPWVITIPVFATAKSNIGWNLVAVSGAQINFGLKYNTPAQNDEITWDVVLAKGTWTFEMLHFQDVDRGIYSIQLDSVEIGTVDGYTATTTANARALITGIVIPLTKKIELKLKVTDKNASSSNYFGSFSAISFLRTA